MLTDFTALLKKWVDLMRGAKTAEDCESLYWNEIYSRVDVDQYGVN